MHHNQAYGTMNAGFFVFGVANMPVMGIKEIAVSYWFVAGGGTSAELTESACEALGLSQEDTRLLSALSGLAVGYTIYSAGSSYLEFYSQNKTAIKAEMAESASYKEASLLDEVVDDVDDLAVANEEKYYIANIVKVVDALCLAKSDYFETYIEGKGTIYTVSRYGVYEKKTEGADIFKLDKWQQVPIFVSKKFKRIVESEECTGMSFREIAVE
jgi:hypothetical protein